MVKTRMLLFLTTAWDSSSRGSNVSGLHSHLLCVRACMRACKEWRQLVKHKLLIQLERRRASEWHPRQDTEMGTDRAGRVLMTEGSGAEWLKTWS